MTPFIQNDQDYLAAKFHINDSHVNQACQLAFLKIQSWKFALRTPSIGKRYRRETEEMLKQSFFTFVPNTHILSEEGFYISPEN